MMELETLQIISGSLLALEGYSKTIVFLLGINAGLQFANILTRFWRF